IARWPQEEDAAEALAGGFAAAGFVLKLVDLFRGLGFRPVLVELLFALTAKRLEVGTLRAGHRLISSRPIFRVFLRILYRCHLVLVLHTEKSARRPPPDLWSPCAGK